MGIAWFDTIATDESHKAHCSIALPEHLRMVCGMAGDCIGIVVDASNYLGALLTANTGSFHSGAGAAGTTKEIDIKESYHFAPPSGKVGISCIEK